MSSTVNNVLNTTKKLKVQDCNLKTCSFCLNYIDEVYNELEIGSIDSIKTEYSIIFKIVMFFQLMNIVLDVKDYFK